MTTNELYRAGKLREAIKALGDELRSNPMDAKRRTFLFELLLFAGEYDRAEKQLDVLAGASMDTAAGALLYRSALHAERTRQKMFLENDLPASKEESIHELGGVCNGSSFTELVDADPRIGSHLEVFIAGSYTWIPFRYLKAMVVEPPVTLRDLIYARARIEATPDFRLQELGEVLLPVLSPLSFQHAEEVIQLGRETAWEEDERYGELPYGAKTWSIDGTDVPLLEIRSVDWKHAVTAAGQHGETDGHVGEEANDASA